METKHTQGTWTVNNTEKLNTHILNNGDESQLIAKVYNKTRKKIIANANLISAAPDLLEALISALPYLYKETRIKAQKAINKAKGESIKWKNHD